MASRQLSLRCQACNKKIFKYLKIGKGRLINCYKSRISAANTKTIDNIVFCSCGAEVGKDCNTYIKMTMDYKL